jgi:hypothetical protein
LRGGRRLAVRVSSGSAPCEVALRAVPLASVCAVRCDHFFEDAVVCAAVPCCVQSCSVVDHSFVPRRAGARTRCHAAPFSGRGAGRDSHNHTCERKKKSGSPAARPRSVTLRHGQPHRPPPPPRRVDGTVYGLRFKKGSRSYTPAPPTTSHCAASNAHTPSWCASSSVEMGSEARARLASQAPGRSRPLTASDGTHGMMHHACAVRGDVVSPPTARPRETRAA